MSAGGDLDESVRRADPDRWLASRFIGPAPKREAVLALLAFDAELARAPRATSSALAAQIRLTWWRDALDELAAGAPARRHPVVQALEAARGEGLDLAPLHEDIEARIEVLDAPPLAPDAALAWADGTAGALAEATARLCDPAADLAAARAGGRVIGLDQLRRAHPEAATALSPLLSDALREARAAARRLSPPALPAVLAATLARAEIPSTPWAGLTRRLRLLTAMVAGTI